MTLFGKNLFAYIRFQWPILALVLIVGLARLSFSLAGVSNSTVKYFSITAAGLIGMILAAVALHVKSFGSYKELLVLLTVQQLLQQVLVAGAIALAIVLGQDNIFSVPEYSGGTDGKTWGHASAHLVLVTTILSFVSWAIGSTILLITRKTVPIQQGIAPHVGRTGLEGIGQ